MMTNAILRASAAAQQGSTNSSIFPARKLSTASLISILPLNDRLSIALELAMKNEKLASEEKIKELIAREGSQTSSFMGNLLQERDNALASLGFKLNHGIIAKRPRKRSRITKRQRADALSAIYCCMLTDDDELVREVKKHFDIGKKEADAQARAAVKEEIRCGRYLCAKEIASAYGLTDISKALSDLQEFVERLNPRLCAAMFGSFGEGNRFD